MKHLVRLALAIVVGIVLFRIHQLMLGNFGVPATLEWEWFVLGYSGTGINPSFAALFSNILALAAAIVVGLCVGFAGGKSKDTGNGIIFLICEIVSSGVVYFALAELSMKWWDKRQEVEKLAILCFLVCSYGISRVLVLSVWLAERLKRKWCSDA
jgi:hypothetical protein